MPFTSPPQYQLWGCTGWTNFRTSLPTATDKVWRVTLTRTSGKRVIIHCNEEEVLNVVMSASTCSDSRWSGKWSRNIVSMRFHSSDNASDYYRAIGN
jgi:hypothetical protein